MSVSDYTRLAEAILPLFHNKTHMLRKRGLANITTSENLALLSWSAAATVNAQDPCALEAQGGLRGQILKDCAVYFVT